MVIEVVSTINNKQLACAMVVTLLKLLAIYMQLSNRQSRCAYTQLCVCVITPTTNQIFCVVFVIDTNSTKKRNNNNNNNIKVTSDKVLLEDK